MWLTISMQVGCLAFLLGALKAMGADWEEVVGLTVLCLILDALFFFWAVTVS